MIYRFRQGRYERATAQLRELLAASPNLIAAMSTICAVLQAKMPHHFWTGFYTVAEENELHVGPYQGAVACQVLRDVGVCLHCVRTRSAVVVPDVEQFPGHRACDSRSKSEICVPVLVSHKVVAVLDVDSERLGQFDDDDVAPLKEIVGLLTPYL